MTLSIILLHNNPLYSMKTPLEELLNEFGKHYWVISNRRIYYLLCNTFSMIYAYTNNDYNNCKINMKNISNNAIAKAHTQTSHLRNASKQKIEFLYRIKKNYL